MLAVYWGEKLNGGNSVEMVGYQASARGGEVRVLRVGDRVKLRGQAVQTMRGHLMV